MQKARLRLACVLALATTGGFVVACGSDSGSTNGSAADGGNESDGNSALDGASTSDGNGNGTDETSTNDGSNASDGGGSADADGGAPAPISEWTWLGGSNATNAAAVYGVLGTGAPANTPGARYASASFIDASNHLWLFGGTPNGGGNKLNDLWKYDGTQWTWVTGASTTNAAGVYGTILQKAATNTPGARYFPAYWTDLAGMFWLYGGKGYDGTGVQGTLDDLWKFDGTEWTWVYGQSTAGTAAVYGTKGTADAANTPGGRYRPITFVDATSHLWLFGGLDAAGNDFGDLWRFDGKWTFVSGSSTPNAPGVYGTKGTADPANHPGAREDSVSWIDAAGHFWLYGGWGYDSAGLQSDLGDLWKFDGTNWTWVSGSNVGNSTASYGALGVTAATNDPGGRENAVAFIAQNKLWLMSGTSSHDVGELDDLFCFDGTNWTWMSGAKTVDPLGVYGPLGTAGKSFAPGGRDSAIAWSDLNGKLWLYGGWGFGATGTASDLNDLWRYEP